LTLTFELNLGMVKRAKYIYQTSFSSKVIIRTHRQPHTHTHTHWTECFAWTTKVVDDNTAP